MNSLTARSAGGLGVRAALLACVLALLPAAIAQAKTTVKTDPPEIVTDTYALVGGVINPDGVAVSYTFQYGETTTYGLTTPLTPAGNGKAEVPVNISLDDLKPNTTYHYRLVATPDASAGPYYTLPTIGEDQTFTTTASLAVAFVGKKAKVSGGRASVNLTAVGPADEVAIGKLTLKAKVGKKTRAIGTARYRVKAGKTKVVAVRLAKAATALIADGKKLKAKASAKTKGVPTPVTTTLKLVAG